MQEGTAKGGGTVIGRVLAVDDSHVIRRLVEVSLEPLDVDVTTVGSGNATASAIAEVTPDVLILDVGLPDMSGWEVLERIRSDPALDGLPVIMLTGYDDADDYLKADAGQVAAYLVKPFRPADLRRIVMDAIGSQPVPDTLGGLPGA